MNLTYEEVQVILEALREKHGPGYSDDARVGPLQAKLSIMLEMKAPRD